MFKNIKALIFDLDGTIADSMWMWRAIDVEFLAKFNIPYQDGLQQEIEGKSFEETAVYFKETFKIDWSLDEIMDCWNEMAYYKYQNEVPLKAGAYEFITKARQKGYKLAIASSNSAKLIGAVLDSHELTGVFDSIVNCSEVKKGKPAPDVYFEAASRINVLPEECMVFEDIVPGILAGVNAGMKVCAVEDKYSLQDRDEKSELADYYAEDFTDLIELL